LAETNPCLAPANEFVGSLSLKLALIARQRHLSDSFQESGYILGYPLGEGTYGTVRRARRARDNKDVAVKELRSLDLASAIVEVSFLELVKHTCVIALLDVYLTTTTINLVFEAFGSCLIQFMQGRPLQSLLLVTLFRDLVEGCCYLHSLRVVHADIKPQNLLTDGSRLRIIDLGNSFSDSPEMRPRHSERELFNRGLLVGTLWYRSPEVLLGCTSYGLPIDVWSAGCVLYELICGTPLFNKSTQAESIIMIFKEFGTPKDWLDTLSLPLWVGDFPSFSGDQVAAKAAIASLGRSASVLLGKMLVCCPAGRATFAQLLQEPFWTENRARCDVFLKVAVSRSAGVQNCRVT
jgi:serine/threonine protein kinase